MGLDHHGAVVGILGIALEALGLLQSQRSPVHAVGAVNFLGDQFHPLAQRHLQGIEELDLVLLLAGLHNHLGQLEGALAAVTPVVGQGAAHTLLLAQLADQSDLIVRIGVELVDADHRDDAGLLDGVHMVEQVLAALLQQLQVLLGVLRGQGTAGDNGGAAAVHLQSPDGGHQHGHVGGQAGEAGLYVPELLKTDVGSKAGLGDMVIKQLQSQTIADNGGLADGDVGEGAGVDQHGLMLHGVADGGVDGVAHPGGHGAGHLQILGGDGVALAVIGHDDLADTLPQILQIPGHRQNGHQLGAHGNAELGLHQVAVLGAADADDDVAQTLGAEVQDPAHLYPLGVDIQALEAPLGQLLVVVVALVLHTGVEGHHGQVVGVHDVVDVASEAQGELSHGHQQGVAAASRSTLDVHGGAAGGLTQAATYVHTQLAQALNEAQRGGGLALAQGGGGNGSHFNEFAVGLILQAVHDLDEVQLGGLAVGDDLVGQQAQLLPEILHGGQGLLRFLGDLPVLVNSGIQRDSAVLVYVLTIRKIDCHGSPPFLRSLSPSSEIIVVFGAVLQSSATPGASLII